MAIVSEQMRWDQRYRSGEIQFGEEPSLFLREQVFRFAPGMKALAVADGQGRNGVWLASQGLHVLSIDISETALQQTREFAARRSVAPQTECCDLTTWNPPLAAFDLVIEISIHFPGEVRRQVHRNLSTALKPGGVYLVEAFHEAQCGRASGGPKDRDMLSTRDKLQEDFRDFSILELMEGTVLLNEGPRHQGEAYMVRMVAQK
jgi:2-polyprenyl-3-methyl-5-hydroxy-6-metoxy-1,4-benzoquinol methylase